MSGNTSYISQGIDYLGFLNAKLRDLSGWGTLLNELVQNADDPDDTTRIILDVTGDALIVENDGLFTDCGSVEQSRCGFDQVGDGRVCCDFHAFRRVASGHKRQEEGTTGAFGIGFISVYQITDQPSLRSGKWLWTLRPEEDEGRRIEATQMDMYQGTRFVLPWAKTNTALRTRLGLEAVAENVVDRMCDELRNALLLSAPFLKRLQTLELRKRGKTEFVVSCMRDADAGEILIDVNGQTRVWKRLDVNFDADAQTLRGKHPGRIEDKRKARVTVAVSLDDLSTNGRLYATLPTEQEVGLPVLINADFFPSSDRKRILFDPDYQGDWNRAAIRAAARAIAGELAGLREALEPVELWKLFESAKGLQRLANEGKVDREFASFWTAIQPQLKSGRFVLSSLRGWCPPEEIRLLQSAKDESPLLPLLESLQQHIVHLDLQRSSTLLRDGDVGVRHFTLDDLSSALTGAGLTRPMALNDAPLWLRNSDNRRQLGIVIEKLHDRVAKDSKPGAEQRVCGCSLVISTDGRLTPAKQLRAAERETRELFADLCPPDYWSSENNPVELSRFVARFSVSDAVNLLQRAGGDAVQKAHEDNERFSSDLIAWFAEHRHVVAQSGDLKNAVRALPMWPSGAKLYRLSELSVPGGFKDPLALARILDPSIAEHWHSFLIDDLHAKELTLETYLIDQVHGAFADEEGPSDAIRQSLMKLLIAHSGTLLDNPSVARALRLVPIVRCTDGVFRCGRDTYFKTDVVVQVLADSVPIAAVSEDSTQAAHGVLAWLGVRRIPDADDILRVVDATIEEGPTQERRERIQSLFKGLAEHWQELEDQQEDLEELRRIAWLPSNKSSAWHKPNELYSVFRDYLFDSQAMFLDVARPTQGQASQPTGKSLFDFLKIETNPPVALVAKHLLSMAEHRKPVNMEVYKFLNLHADSPPINLLHGKKCLCLDDDTYIEPGKTMWGVHRFGRFRVRLSPEWRQCQKLLEALGVSDEEPAADDAIAVLKEIATDYSDNRKLDESDYEVLIQCWALMSEQLGAEIPDWPHLLADRKVVANANRFLVKTSEVLFDDRPGMVDRFGETIRRLVIRRPESAWRAMSRAGVLFLSDVLSSELVECTDSVLDDDLTRKLSERWPLVRRVFATREDRPVAIDMISSPKVWQSQRLTLEYRVLNIPAPVEDVAAHMTGDMTTLYVRAGGKSIWFAIAKELAFAYFPDGGAGILASAIKDVLLADDLETAREGLNELGISDVDFDTGRLVEGAEAGLGAVVSDNVGVRREEWLHPDAVDPLSEEGQTSSSDPTDGDVPAEVDSGTGGSGKSSSASVDADHSGDHRPKTDSTGRSGKTSAPTGDRPKLRSYMVHGNDGDREQELPGAAKQHRDHTDRSGVDQVLAFERQESRFPTEMAHDHEGYDVESRNASGEIVRYIEIKSMGCLWDAFGVGLSAPQFRMAQEKKDLFWLYVVEDAISSKPKIHRIQNPASQIVEYRFDDGWQIVAETDTVPERCSLRDTAPTPLSNRSATNVNV